MHHFVVKFSKNFFASGDKGALTPLSKFLRTFLYPAACDDTDIRSSILASARERKRDGNQFNLTNYCSVFTYLDLYY